MRITGLEPARLLTIEPKSIASANSAISACYKRTYNHLDFLDYSIRYTESQEKLYLTFRSFIHHLVFMETIVHDFQKTQKFKKSQSILM